MVKNLARWAELCICAWFTKSRAERQMPGSCHGAPWQWGFVQRTQSLSSRRKPSPDGQVCGSCVQKSQVHLQWHVRTGTANTADVNGVEWQWQARLWLLKDRTLCARLRQQQAEGAAARVKVTCPDLTLTGCIVPSIMRTSQGDPPLTHLNVKW